MQDLAEFGVLAAALDEVGEFVADFVAEEALEAGEVDELGNAADADGGAEEVADGGAVRIAAGQGGEILRSGVFRRIARQPEHDVGGLSEWSDSPSTRPQPNIGWKDTHGRW